MLALAVFAASLASLSGPRLPPSDAIAFDTAIVEVSIGTVATVVMTATFVDGTARLPLAQILAIAELPAANDSAGYLSTDSLSSLLKTPIAVDWDELTVTITDDGTLPVSQRVAREQRRAQFDALRAPLISQTAIRARTAMLPHGMILDYVVGAVNSPGSLEPSVRVGLGTSMLGGAVDVDWERTRRFGKSTLLWQRSWPDNPLLRDVRVGTVQIADLIIGPGVFISSAPPNRDEPTTPIVLAGSAAPGWQLEVYRDDLLIYTGLADSTGRYSVAVPSFRGINRLVLIAYGPRGERRRTARYVSIGDSMIRGGTGAFDLAFGRCTDADCSYAGQLHLSYAPYSSVTVGAGMSALFSRAKPLLEPSTLIAFRLRHDINTIIHANSRGTVIQSRYAPSDAFELAAAYNIAASASAPQNAPVNNTFGHLTAVWRSESHPTITGEIELPRSLARDEIRLLFGSSFVVGSVYIRPFVRLSKQRHPASSRLPIGAYVDLPIPFLSRRVRARGTLGTQFSDESSLFVTLPIANVARVESGVTWIPGVRSPQVNLAINMETHAFRYDARSLASGPATSTSHEISGSITVAGQRELSTSVIALSANQSRGRSAIVGTVFADENGNGTRDATERALPGVAVITARYTAESDSAGLYYFYDVIPFQPVVLVVDSLTLPDSGMRVRAVRVVPLPNGATRVDIPVVVAPSQSTSGGVTGIDRVAQHAQSGDSTSVHRNHLESGPTNTHAVTNPRQPAESRENESAEGRPVAFRDIEAITRARINER